ncbi:hypothetical protein MTO96_005013 [Rhipicephalus appendiculatus]
MRGGEGVQVSGGGGEGITQKRKKGTVTSVVIIPATERQPAERPQPEEAAAALRRGSQRREAVACCNGGVDGPTRACSTGARSHTPVRRPERWWHSEQVWQYGRLGRASFVVGSL